MEPDIEANRVESKWTSGELARRALWEILRNPLFAWTPRPFWAWRIFVLRAFGARIGRQVHVFPSVKIAIPWNLEIGDQAAIGDGAVIYSLGKISIGRAATVSQYAHLCAGSHDHTKKNFPLLKLPIAVGAGAWICADAFVGPDVRIGRLAVVGARSVVIHDVPDGAVVAGNPATVKGIRVVS